MLKSWRSKLFILFIILGGRIILLPFAAHAGSVQDVTIGFLWTNPDFIANSSTNTSANDIIINVFDEVGATPDAGQTVTVRLLESGSVLSNGMTEVTFETKGTNPVYGGDTRPEFKFFKAGASFRLQVSAGTNTFTPSDSFSVSTGPASQLVVLGPGMTHVPGTNPDTTSGFSGSFTPQTSGEPFTVTVILADGAFNRVPTADNLSFSADGALVTFPATGSLAANGRADFQFTILGPQLTRIITVDDTTDGAVSNGTLTITTAGPPAREVTPFPSPFNPKTGNITFRFRLDRAESVNLIVTNILGQKVWERTVSGVTGQFNDVSWNGKNEKGETVAAGVYYVLTEVDGSVESKSRFGVIK